MAKKMAEMTTEELIDIHNQHCEEDDKLSSWEGSNEELIEKLKSMDLIDTPSTVKVGDFVSDLLQTTSLSYSDIEDLAKQEFPKARTSTRSIASIACRLRKEGLEVPKRSRGRAKGMTMKPKDDAQTELDLEETTEAETEVEEPISEPAEMSDHAQEGYQAYDEGNTIDANPYEPTEDAHDEWNKGWEAAAAEDGEDL